MAKGNTIGKNLKAFRLNRLMTQTKVASFLGISRATVARLERGESCSDLMRAKIEKQLGQAVAA
jgi:DNA-binding XRE family transcriptional regulator